MKLPTMNFQLGFWVISMLLGMTPVLAKDPSGDFPQLRGASRQIAAASRAAVVEADQLHLPEALSLLLSEQEIRVALGGHSSAALLVQRTHRGELWKLSGQEEVAAATTRAIAAVPSAGGAMAYAAPPIGLDQLLAQSVFRGASLLTPAPGARLLTRKPTFRLIAVAAQGKERTLALRHGNQTLVTLVFSPDQTAMRWDEIADLPEALKNGITAGEFTIFIDGTPAGSFIIEPPETVDWVVGPCDEFTELLGEHSTAAKIFRVETLLVQRDLQGRPAPYLCDALEVLDSIEPSNEYAASCRARILGLLGHRPPQAASPSPTGNEAIDAVRQAIQEGRWIAAQKQALALTGSSDSRTARLAKLYLAVIAGETTVDSVHHSDHADALFRETLEGMDAEHPEDAFRVHHNYAIYLSRKVQSRVYNYSLHAATNLESPLLMALWYWEQARVQFAAATKFKGAVTPQDHAALALNRARHQATLGDFLRNLSDNDDGLAKLLVTADRSAKELAMTALKVSDADTMTRAAAAELLAHLAYRADQGDEAERWTRAAIEDFEAIGSLAGLAGAHRTLGLLAGNSGQLDQGIEHLEVSLRIGDLLRNQVELTGSGIDRAGYFARHAYTNERMIQWLIERGDAERALEVAELAKARAFEDLLRRRHADSQIGRESDEGFPTLEEALELVDTTTVVIEYYVGVRDVYAFVILPDGQVSAHRLSGAEGEPLAAAALLRRVAEFLAGMEGRARKMIFEARTPGGFDKAWQHTLHQFYLDLIPQAAREAVATAEHLVVIPHHILHYFPFAALVTQVDSAPRARFELPQPRFLIESDLDITTAPSLRAYAHLVDRPSLVNQASMIGVSEFEGAPQLPGVVQDLKNYQQVFSGRLGRLLHAKPITEAKIAAAMSDDATLLFIATHGMNLADRPLESFLLCDSDDDSDGRLTASELFQKVIGCDAIVLSACYSGLADRSPLPGDDLFGMQRAMLQGGANSIVSGFWDVYDDTAPQLMFAAMKHFANGQTLSASLAAAQRDFLAQRKAKGPGELWIHPYFWAVYGCSGSGRTMISN